LIASCKVDVSSKDNKSELAVYGTILHQVLQAALEQNNFDKAVIEANIKNLLRDNVVNLYANEIDEEKAFGELKQHIEALSEWGSKYLNSADGGYLNNNTKRVRTPFMTSMTRSLKTDSRDFSQSRLSKFLEWRRRSRRRCLEQSATLT